MVATRFEATYFGRPSWTHTRLGLLLMMIKRIAAPAAAIHLDKAKFMSAKTLVRALALAVTVLISGSTVAARDQLVIGVAQFPSTLHPNVDAEVVKSYVLGFIIRQITAYDESWKNSCLFCASNRVFSNGSRGGSPILSVCAIPKCVCVLCVLQGT